jgi:hypothetical protein
MDFYPLSTTNFSHIVEVSTGDESSSSNLVTNAFSDLSQNHGLLTEDAARITPERSDQDQTTFSQEI